MLILMAGLPATGKSSIARQVARDLPAILLDKDSVRAALFPPSEIDYSVHQDDLCVRAMLQAAFYMLHRDQAKHIIVDGRPFSRAYQVAECAQVAERLHVPLRLIHCYCSDDTARKRLERDAQEGSHVAANRDFRLYQALKERFEPITREKLLLNTDDSLRDCVQSCLAYLRAAQ
jgi:predicted kinase